MTSSNRKIQLSEQIERSAVTLRQELHKYPAVSGDEAVTAQRIKKWLYREVGSGINLQTDIGGHGLLLSFASGESVHTKILIRVDIDALPIQEQNKELEHRSTYKNKAHLCGHDGHTAIGCALASLLNEHPLDNTAVDIIFQPAEETGQGAQQVINDPNFSVDQYDYAFALHNLPGYPLHEIVVKKGAFTAAVDSPIFRFRGSTSHAGEPEHGRNPSAAIASLLQKALSLNEEHRSDNEDHLFVSTPVYTRIGAPAYGTSPGDGEAHFTLRSWDNDQLDDMLKVLQTCAQELAEKHELSLNYRTTQSFSVVLNDKEALSRIISVAERSDLNHTHKPHPFKWGEDFGRFTEHVPGAMFGLGSGSSQPALHRSVYDFPDQLVRTGAEFFYQLSASFEE